MIWRSLRDGLVGPALVLLLVYGAAIVVADSALHETPAMAQIEGAFDAMGTGQVDENWLRQHHSAWFAELEEENETVAVGAAYQSAASARKRS